MRRWIGAALGAVMLTGCTTAYKQAAGLDDTNPASIEVTLPVAAEVAQQRVQAAAVDGGWTVTSSQPGVVTVGPYGLKQDNSVKVTLVANVLPTDAGSRVVIRGTATDGFEQRLGGRSEAENRPIRQATSGRNAWKWAEVERLAAAIRGTP